jgi:hypothetical protein
VSLADAQAQLIDTLPGNLPRQVINELCHGWKMREVLAAREQMEIAQAQPLRTWVNGLGQMTMAIQADAYHYWGQRLGYRCWRDKAFRREFLRDNPGARVTSRARKTILRVQGFRDQKQ